MDGQQLRQLRSLSSALKPLPRQDATHPLLAKAYNVEMPRIGDTDKKKSTKQTKQEMKR
jgi:hypothetical protein